MWKRVHARPISIEPRYVRIDARFYYVFIDIIIIFRDVTFAF